MTDTRRDNPARPLTPARTSAGPGFTLVEVMVVIFILGILAAIVVSVAGYVMNSSSRRETEGTQTVLLGAVQAFYDAGNPKAYPQDRYGDPNAAYYKNAYIPEKSGKVLMNFLTGKFDSLEPNVSPPFDVSQTAPVKAAVDVLLKLPEEAWKGGASEPVRDGWGRDMRYEYDPNDPNRGGLGGRPVVISAGPDGDFGASGNTQEEDNIRSDESQ